MFLIFINFFNRCISEKNKIHTNSVVDIISTLNEADNELDIKYNIDLK